MRFQSWLTYRRAQLGSREPTREPWKGGGGGGGGLRDALEIPSPQRQGRRLKGGSHRVASRPRGRLGHATILRELTERVKATPLSGAAPRAGPDPPLPCSPLKRWWV